MFVMPGEGLFAVGITSINGYLFNVLNGNSGGSDGCSDLFLGLHF